MAIGKEQIEHLIYQAIDELNMTRESAPIEKSETTALYGQQSPLDSVDLVTLLIAIEELLEDDLNIEFTIANDKAMSLKNSPFKSVSSLTQYLVEELGEH